MNRTVSLIVLLLIAVSTVCGQAVSSVAGTVTDPSGAVIPGATIVLENVDTGIKRQDTSDPAGRYSFLQVQPGNYRVTAKATGFNDVVINDVHLLVNSPLTLPVTFEKVGTLADTVTVSAEAAQLNTTDASIGNAIGNKPIVQLPLNARNIVGLLAMQTGVVFTTEGDTDSRNGAVNGGKSDQANVTLDGVDVNDQMDRYAFTSVLRMTPDSTQEFRFVTTNATADMGRTSGAQIVMVTKSGSNDLHGSLYEYHRNTITSANSFFGNLSGVEREKLIRNIFGASAGGPIKKNRVFLFGNYEGRRDARDGSAVRTIPSMDMRQGILHYQRKDGSVATVTPQDIAAKLDPRGLDQNVMKLLQGYPVPNDSTVGDNLNLVGYRFKAPMPLRWNTYIAKADYVLDQSAKHQLFVRGNLQNDHQVGSLPQFPGQPPNSIRLTNNKGLATGLTSVLRPDFISNFRYGFTRQGFETTGASNISAVSLRGLSDSVGLTRSFSTNIPVHTFAEDMNWTKGAHALQFGGVVRTVRARRVDYQNSYSSASANASWLINSGSDLSAPFTDMASSSTTLFRYAMTSVLGLVTQGNAQYNYRVDGSVIGEGNPVLRDFAGNEYEMYLQDTWKIGRAMTVMAGVRYSLMPPIYEVNGQQVSPDVPIGDWFKRRGELAAQGKSQMEVGRLSFIPTSQGGSPLYDYHKKNFAPRVSLAYSPQGTGGLSRFFFGGPGKTSIRLGFGMYYDLFGTGLMRSYDATAFGLSNALTNPAATLTIATAPRFTSIDQIPKEIMLPAPPAKFPAVYPDIFTIGRGLDSTVQPPYTLNANISIQREFRGGWFVQGSYVNRTSRRSLIRTDAAIPTNIKDPKSGMTYFEAATILARQVVAGVPVGNVQPVPYWENLYSKAATSTQTATQVAYSRFNANQWDWTYALYQLDTGAGQGGCDSRNRCSNLGPYAFYHPQFSYMSVFSSMGYGDYNAMQWTVRKRFSGGDSFDINYTFSKSMDLRSYTERAGYSTGVIWNPWFPDLSRGLSDYDNTHLFNMFGVYNLPFGKGKKFANGVNGFVNAIIGGWQIAGAWRWSSGFPISVYETSVWPTNWNNNNWASWNLKPFDRKQTKNAPAITGAGGPNMFPNPKQAYDAFQYVMPGEIGMRNGIRGDGIFNIDTNLSKRFVMPYGDGKHSLQVRWETFNLTNTAKFDVATASLDVAIAGTFGKYVDQLTQPRVMQFGLRYEF